MDRPPRWPITVDRLADTECHEYHQRPKSGIGLRAAVALAAVDLLAPKAHTLALLPDQAMTSFGGGIAATYVFLYLLP